MTAEQFTKGMAYLVDWFNSITAAQWYVTGVIIGAILGTIGITAYVKRRHLKKYAEKLASEFIVLNVAFWGFVLNIAGFVITQGTTFSSLLPFIGSHWAQISGGAIAVHAVATALYKHFKAKKEQKTLDFINGLPALPQDDNLGAIVEQVKAPVPASAPSNQPLQL
jgi:hypothetical protein